MESTKIPNLPQKVCRVGLGTWAIGGTQWGGAEIGEGIETIHKALDLGLNFIDTAPVYGFGLAEEIVGKALSTYTGNKDHLVIATKVGLDWEKGSVFRDSRKMRIEQEVEDSLKRLKIDAIDLYQVHWPDFETPFEESAEALNSLLQQGKIKAIGVSNFTAEMMQAFQKFAPIHALQSPYNLFERVIDAIELPFCKENGIALLGYGSLCRGLLSGKIERHSGFKGDDIRKIDPKFSEPNFSHYLECVKKLKKWVAAKHNRSILELSIRWVLDRGINVALWGVRRPEQLDVLKFVWGWKLEEEDFSEIDQIVNESVPEPLNPDFMAPKARKNMVTK